MRGDMEEALARISAPCALLVSRELLNAHKDNLGTTIKFVIFNELSNARNPNNMQILYTVLQHSSELAPKVGSPCGTSCGLGQAWGPPWAWGAQLERSVGRHCPAWRLDKVVGQCLPGRGPWRAGGAVPDGPETLAVPERVPPCMGVSLRNYSYICSGGSCSGP